MKQEYVVNYDNGYYQEKWFNDVESAIKYAKTKSNSDFVNECMVDRYFIENDKKILDENFHLYYKNGAECFVLESPAR